MYVAPFAVPTHILFTHKADGDHHELQIEPVIPEPQEQIGAENDRNRTKTKSVVALSRPGQQHVKAKGKQYLRRQQQHMFVNRVPVIPPVQVDAELDEHLDIVLRAQHNIEAVRLPVLSRHQNMVQLPHR